MLINLDAKQLEWVCAIYLSGDKVGYGEIREGVDLHSANQERFRLPARVVAKQFLFRLIYADPNSAAYAFSVDPEFAHVSTSQSFWQRVVDEAYGKYSGLESWHNQLIQECSKNNGLLTVPCTKRSYLIQREDNEWPIAKIFNYPVQGLGHDLMAILRCILRTQLIQKGMESSLLTSTVHDSVLLDCPQKDCLSLITGVFQASEQVPLDFRRRFGVEFDLPFRVEVKVGPNWGDMKEITKEMIL